MTRQLNPLEFHDAIVSEMNDAAVADQRRAQEKMATDRVRNTLGNANRDLTPTMSAFSKQFEKVIRQEPLSRKSGRGFFSVRGDR
jgi:hypothetical protein